MKNTKINKYFYYIFLCVLLIGSQIVRAGETFQNNLIKTEVHKNSLGAVKVTLYTSKPYSEGVSVNKKSATEYVILMPETSNSLTTKPSIASVSDVVKSVEVKTQQYGNQLRGYTKITISTTKPIEIVPHVQTLSASQFSDKDYNELLAEATKAKKTVSKKEPTAKISPKKGQEVLKTKKETTKKELAEKKSKAPLLAEVPSKKVLEKKKSSKNEAVRESKKVKSEPRSARVASKPEKIEKSIDNTASNTPKQQVKEEPAQTPAATSSPEQQAVQEPTSETPVSQNVPPVVEQTAVAPVEPVSQVSEIQKYKNIIKNNIYAAFGLIIAIFLILLMAARKMTKNLKKQKEIFTSNLEEKPVSAVDYSEKIKDDMNWREKYQTYVDTKESSESVEPARPEKDFSSDLQELDGLFGNEPLNIEEEQNDTPQTENEPEVQPIQASSDFDEVEDYSMEDVEVSIDDLFDDEDEFDEGVIPETESLIDEDLLDEEDETELVQEDEEVLYFEPEPVVQEVEEEEDELIKSEFIISDGKGFYLVDFEDTTALVGQIDDEIFVLKRFNEKVKAPIQARLNETKQNSLNYMTKVGSFKGIVEVTPDKMNLLIEL